jgi:hypothetical protein
MTNECSAAKEVGRLALSEATEPTDRPRVGDVV